MNHRYETIPELHQKIVTKIVNLPEREGLEFYLSDYIKVSLKHIQDCCEDVWLEDITGELTDLIEVPLEVAEVCSKDNPDACESGTFTFYRFRTSKGDVDLRFCGESNGYYSEGVDVIVEDVFDEITSLKKSNLKLLGKNKSLSKQNVEFKRMKSTINSNLLSILKMME